MSSFLQTLLSMAAVCIWGMTGVAQAQNAPPAPSDTPSPPSMAGRPTTGTPATPRTNDTPSTTGAGVPGTSDSTSGDYRSGSGSGSDNTTRGSSTNPGVPGTTPSDNNYNQGNGMNNRPIRQPRGDRN